MVDRLRLSIELSQDASARFTGEADRQGIHPGQLAARLLEDIAHLYDPPPPPPLPKRRSLREVREEARLRGGGVSPYTETIQIIRGQPPAP
jgi:hypothetical protein